VVRVVGIAGSLRQGSYNRALLRAAIELAPADLRIEPFDRLGELPLYDADAEARGVPDAVAALKTAMRQADGILIATPEYNHSIPGVLKNAIDWASRPAGQAAYDGKPIGIIGATPGRGATIRAQAALRQSLGADALLLGKPEVLIAQAAGKFDSEGRLTDEPTIRVLRAFLVAFAAWVRRFSDGGSAQKSPSRT
jgi:chromate reductase